MSERRPTIGSDYSGFDSEDDDEFFDAAPMDGEDGPLHIPDSLKSALFDMDGGKDAHKPDSDSTTVVLHGTVETAAHGTAPAPSSAPAPAPAPSPAPASSAPIADVTVVAAAAPASSGRADGAGSNVAHPRVTAVASATGSARGPSPQSSPGVAAQVSRNDSDGSGRSAPAATGAGVGTGGGAVTAGAGQPLRPSPTSSDGGAGDDSGNPMPLHHGRVAATGVVTNGSDTAGAGPEAATGAASHAEGGSGGSGAGAGSGGGAGGGIGASEGAGAGAQGAVPAYDPTAGYPPDVPEPVTLPDGSVDPATVHPSVAHLFLKDADTGKMFRIDRIGDDFFQDLATFDTFLGLGERKDSVADDGSGSDSGAEGGDEGGKSTAKKVGGFIKSMFGKKRGGAGKGDKEGADKKGNEGFVRVHTQKKDVKELTKVMLCQHLHVHTGPVWTMKFSYDGQYLATAGQDTNVLVWKVSSFGSESDGDSTVSNRSSGSATANPGSHARRKVPTLAEATKAEARAAAGAPPGGAGMGVGRAPTGAGPGAGAGHSRSSSGGGAPPAGGSTETETPDGLKCKGTPLFDSGPIRTYTGHSTHVVDLAWSRDYFLLSASMDSYVRLWHISRAQCLHKFQHPDCVTAVCFHPTEENYFLTGCFDKKLRVWNRQSGRVIMWQPTPVMVTAAAFNPNGRVVVAGLYNGQCVLYNVQSNGFAYHTQIDCRNRRGRLRKGRKVTGIVFVNNGAEMLVTTNDSRCRLISLDDFSMTFKYGGLRNNNMQIKASCGTSGERVICGSENKHVYVWRTRHDMYTPSINPRLTGFKRNKNKSYEFFQAHDDVVTVALFAPDSLLPLRPPCPSDAMHTLMVTAGMKGDVRVFENVGAPEKL